MSYSSNLILLHCLSETLGDVGRGYLHPATSRNVRNNNDLNQNESVSSILLKNFNYFYPFCLYNNSV